MAACSPLTQASLNGYLGVVSHDAYTLNTLKLLVLHSSVTIYRNIPKSVISMQHELNYQAGSLSSEEIICSTKNNGSG